MQCPMDLEYSDLLLGEDILLTKPASIAVSSLEGIKGKLYLTNYRLIFKADKLNLRRGKFSIFLPTIAGMRGSSFLLTRKVIIKTKIKDFEFFIGGIQVNDFIEAVEITKAALREETISRIRQEALQYSEKCYEGLKVLGDWKIINKVFLEGQKPMKLEDPKPSEAASTFSTQMASMTSTPYKILREFAVQEDTETLAVDELPLDNRFGSTVLILEQEFSKSAVNEISFESTYNQQGKLTVNIIKLLQAELSLDLSKSIGYKHGEITTCRYTTTISVNTGDFIMYKITWKRKIRRSNYEVLIDDQHHVIPVVARYGVEYGITSSRKDDF